MDLYVKLILLCPLVVAVLGLLLPALRGRGIKLPGIEPALAVASAAVGFLCVVGIWVTPLDGASTVKLFDWLYVPTGPDSNFTVAINLRVDEISRLMLTVVTFVGLLVHVFSLSYMAEDPGKNRFFSGLALFMFSMLGIVLADNLLMMFVFWELVGVSSYLLIGHWFTKPSAGDAAKKAFIVNRIGDFGFMLGILMLWGASGGALSFDDLRAWTESPEFGGLDSTYLWIAVVCLFMGAVGKSAQVPLHIWLPDAMEGPTPVSALIHAATMVAAGVYMMAQISFLVEMAPIAGTVIAMVGVITAVLAALMALEQDDIKRILAYSTLSQLGYMIMAVGLGAPDAAMFHLTTHAAFKALLFLGSGAIIHALHHEQDIWHMGGLAKKMPVTFLTFTIGTLALTGCPYILAGFYSKDEILLSAFDEKLIFGLACFVAVLTAFYMFRLWAVVFLGTPRTKHAEHAHEVGPLMLAPLLLLAIPSIAAGYPFVRDMYMPHTDHAAHAPIVPGGTAAVEADEAASTAHPAEGHHDDAYKAKHNTVVAISIGAFLIGALGALALFNGKTRQPYAIPGVSSTLRNRFYIDDFYAYLVRSTHDALAAFSGFFDRWIIDGLFIRGLGVMSYGVGSLVRYMQAGNLQGYSLLFALGVIVILIITVF